MCMFGVLVLVFVLVLKTHIMYVLYNISLLVTLLYEYLLIAFRLYPPGQKHKQIDDHHHATNKSHAFDNRSRSKSHPRVAKELDENVHWWTSSRRLRGGVTVRIVWWCQLGDKGYSSGDVDSSVWHRQCGRRAPAAAARRLPHRVQPHPLQPPHCHVQVRK